jgi:hypothetical protein
LDIVIFDPPKILRRNTMKKLFAMALVALFVASTSSLVLAEGTTAAPAAAAAPAKPAVKKAKKSHKKKAAKPAAAAPAAAAPAAK